MLQEAHELAAVIIRKSDLKDKLAAVSKSRLYYPRIPNVVHLDRSYETFTLHVLGQDTVLSQLSLTEAELLADYVAVLVEPTGPLPDGLVHATVMLTLNGNYFTHRELIYKLTDEKVEFSAYEMIGDIIHLNLTSEQLPYKQIIGDVIHFKTGRTVINKTGIIEEKFRYYHSEVLAGPPQLQTVHVENGVKFFIDLEKVYWCTRLQPERARILKLVKKGEVICDPFCGVGPHVIPAIKKGASALCNDLNPAAVACLKKSLEINKLSCSCIENLDAAVFLQKIRGRRVDHFIFNLPEYSLDYIKYTALFEGTFKIHAFFFSRDGTDCLEVIREKTGFAARKEWVREVRKVSPSKGVYKLEVDSGDFFGRDQK